MAVAWPRRLPLVLAASLLFSLGRPGTAEKSAAARIAPWQYHADFRNGLSGWMSYPPAQDIGFDPTLSTERAGPKVVLMRQVDAIGQKSLRLGFVRPLVFVARPETRIRLRYTLEWASPRANWSLILGGADGRRYAAPLPAVDGTHSASIDGRQLRVPEGGVAVEAVVLAGQVEGPRAGMPIRLQLREFDLESFREDRVAVLSPALVDEVDGTRTVAAEVVARDRGLTLELGPSASPVRVVLKSGGGRIEVDRTLSASAATASRHLIPLGPAADPGLWTAELSGGGRETRFSFLVVGPAAAHPRLWLSPRRIQQLRSAPECAALRTEIRKRARAQGAEVADNAAAGANIAKLPAGRSLRVSYVGELNPYFDLLDSYADAIAFNALDYQVTGDRDSLEAARRALLAAVHWDTWTPPRFAAHGLHTYYHVGVFAQPLAFGYDLIANQLTLAEKEEVAQAFWQKAIQPTVDEYYRFNRMPTGASNWMANSVGGALAAAVAVEDDVPQWRGREGIAVAELAAAYERNLRGLFPGDGSEAEPAGYENFALEGLSSGLAALEALHVKPVGIGKMYEAFWWPYYAMVRRDLVLDTGDFNGRLRTLSGFALGAEQSGIPALRAFFDGRAGTAPEQGRQTEPALSPLGLVCCTRPPEAAPTPPRSRVFAGRGSAVLRSDWDSDATVISLRAGPWFNHEHHDQGSFQVAAFGSRVITEAGFPTYQDPNYASYFIEAAGHNTVLLDDDAFSQSSYDGRLWKAFHDYPRLTEHFLAARFDYIAADLAPAYGGRISRYQRQYLFLPPDVLVVYDELQSPEPHVFNWLLHAAEEATPRLDENRARIETASAQADVVAVHGCAKWEMRPTPLPVSVFQDFDHTKIRDRYVLRLSSGKSQSARFLVAMRFRGRGNGSGDSNAWSVTPLPPGDAVGFQSADPGVSAGFRAGAGVLRVGNFETDGSGMAIRNSADGEQWMVLAARSVKQNHRQLALLTSPADVAWSRTGNAVQVNLQLRSAGTVELHAPWASPFVTVDGVEAAGVVSGSAPDQIVIGNLSQGEHSVHISARTAF